MPKAVAKREESMPAFSNERPDWVGEGQRGSEGVTAQDMTIPRIDVLQSLSPQVSKRKDEYIEGAEPGLLFNTATGELLGESVIVVPVYYRREYVVWKDRDAGGGFRGAFRSQAEAVEHMQSLDDGGDCDITETAQHFVMVAGATGGWSEAVVSLSKGKAAASRKWNTQIHMAGGDRWSKAYKLSPTLVEGAKGEYFSLKTDPLGWVDEDTFKRAESLYEAISRGDKDVDRGGDVQVGPDSPEL